jgi:hypothetical protein
VWKPTTEAKRTSWYAAAISRIRDTIRSAGDFVVSTTDLRPTGPIIPLQCSSWSSFAERYVDDLARGALCIPHPDSLPLLSTVSVQLSLPEALDVTLGARIVHVLTGAHAEPFGGRYALALELQLDPETKRQLAQLVEFARTQRQGDDAQSSFTHAMLEHTPSLAPREVGMRLSLMPTQPAAAAKRSPSAPLPAVPSESGYRHVATIPPTSEETTPLRTVRPIRGKAEEPATPPQQAAAEPPAPPDPLKLKALLSHVARKQYDVALRITNELLQANPADRGAQRWRALCHARIALSRNDNVLAAKSYEAILEIDPSDREAREFLKAHERTKKLESLPFGRFFTKKK